MKTVTEKMWCAFSNASGRHMAFLDFKKGLNAALDADPSPPDHELTEVLNALRGLLVHPDGGTYRMSPRIKCVKRAIAVLAKHDGVGINDPTPSNEELLKYKTALEMLGIENDGLRAEVDHLRKQVEHLLNRNPLTQTGLLPRGNLTPSTAIDNTMNEMNPPEERVPTSQSDKLRQAADEYEQTVALAMQQLLKKLHAILEEE